MDSRQRIFIVRFSEVMMALSFGLTVFCLFEARVLQIGYRPALVSNRQNTFSPKYNIFLLI